MHIQPTSIQFERAGQQGPTRTLTAALIGHGHSLAEIETQGHTLWLRNTVSNDGNGVGLTSILD